MNSHVLIQDDHKMWYLYTFLPFQNGCSTLTALRLATFTSSNATQKLSLSMNELYPRKLKNFNKCPIYIAASNSAPFVIFYNTSDGRGRFEGIDPLICQQIAKIHNFTIVYKGISDKSDLGVYENGTGFGHLYMVCMESGFQKHICQS